MRQNIFMSSNIYHLFFIKIKIFSFRFFWTLQFIVAIHITLLQRKHQNMSYHLVPVNYSFSLAVLPHSLFPAPDNHPSPLLFSFCEINSSSCSHNWDHPLFVFLCLASLNMMIFSSIHVVTNDRILFFFMAE